MHGPHLAMRVLALSLFLTACGPAGPKTEAQAKSAIESTLSERYGEPFTVATVRKQARGLEGFEADRHAFTAYPDSDPARAFEGIVDYDEEHATWSDTWPCIRDADAVQAALDAAIEGLHIRRSESRCDESRLAEVDPATPGAAFVWSTQVAVFGELEPKDGQDEDAALLEANAPLHTRFAEAAAAAGVQLWGLKVDRFARGEDIAKSLGDAPLSPAMQMWFEGTTVSAYDVELEVGRVDYRALGVEKDLLAIAEQHLPPTGEVWVRVRSNELSHQMVKQSPNLSLSEVPEGQRPNLAGIVALTVVGTPETQDRAVRDWITRLHQALPKGRFSPSVYVAFYAPDTDPDVSRGLQIDKQETVWLVNSGLGIRVRRTTMDGVQPITAIRYVVPGDAP